MVRYIIEAKTPYSEYVKVEDCTIRGIFLKAENLEIIHSIRPCVVGNMVPTEGSSFTLTQIVCAEGETVTTQIISL